MTKYYTLSGLLQYMADHGLPYSRMWVRTSEKQGKLVCPRRPNSRRDRVFTESQMEEIIKAFSPNGVGQWRY